MRKGPLGIILRNRDWVGLYQDSNVLFIVSTQRLVIVAYQFDHVREVFFCGGGEGGGIAMGNAMHNMNYTVGKDWQQKLKIQKGMQVIFRQTRFLWKYDHSYCLLGTVVAC